MERGAPLTVGGGMCARLRGTSAAIWPDVPPSCATCPRPFCHQSTLWVAGGGMDVALWGEGGVDGEVAEALR